jgi:hypothetical protein
MSREKEPDFFIQEGNWEKGIDWYKSQFRGIGRICGESSVKYTTHPVRRGVPERIYSVMPEAKLIYIVRDPIYRVVSDYVQLVTDGIESRDIQDVLQPVEDSPYVWRSRYYTQLEQYLSYFPRSSILVMTLEDLSSNPKETMRQVFDFLGVHPGFYSPEFYRVKHPTREKRRKNKFALVLKRMAESRLGRIFHADFRRAFGRVLYYPISRPIDRPVLSESLHVELRDYLKDDVARLRRFAGHEFGTWLL